MDQVRAAHKPTVEVTISPQLRALFAQRFDASANDLQAQKEEADTDRTPGCQPIEPESGDDWRPIILRRDGARPAQFSGQLVFEVTETWTIAENHYDHTFAVYTDPAGALTGALRLEPRRQGALRPVFWCHPISDVSAFMVWIEQWWRTTLTEFIATADPSQMDTTALPATLRAVLHTLTAQSLRMLQPNLERNDQCHQ